jgi:NAD(P)-dependent dehydrogenase (short-subunit alcohol dehydrogenase family)
MAEIALITGASGTLGKSVAQRLAAAGYRLVLSGRKAQKMAASDLPEGLKVGADLSSAEETEKLFQAITDHYGEPASLLAHCAGSILIRPLHRTTPEQYRSCLQNNLDSAFYTLQGFVQGVLQNKTPGRAVLVSSIAARIGISNHAAVAAAKAGVEGLVRSVAATYSGQGVRVNGIAPGMMRTAATEGFFAGEKAEKQIASQYPLGRYGQAGDAAGLICWLLSAEAEWLTGQIITIDGGFSSIWPLSKR